MLHDGGADEDADDDALTASQTAATENRGGDGVELVEAPEVHRLGRTDVEDEEHPAEAGEQGADDVGEDDHLVGVDP